MLGKGPGSVLSFRIPDEWSSSLEELARKEYLTKSDIVRRAIKEYLDKHQPNVSPERLGGEKER